MTNPSCATCVLCLRADYGYSNWTVEGTTLACLAGLNPALEGTEEASPWSESEMKELAPILDVALTCPKYRFGAPARQDVEVSLGTPFFPQATAELVIKVGYTDDFEAATLLAARINAENS